MPCPAPLRRRWFLRGPGLCRQELPALLPLPCSAELDRIELIDSGRESLNISQSSGE